MKKWYLAYCKPKEEARARAHLDAQGIESYYPMVEIEKLRRGKRVPVREPMFPNYLFIFVDLEEVTPVTLKSTRGISRIIHFGSEWTPISSKLVYQLMSRDDSDEARASYASLPCSGDKVLIEEGPLGRLRSHLYGAGWRETGDFAGQPAQPGDHQQLRQPHLQTSGLNPRARRIGAWQ